MATERVGNMTLGELTRIVERIIEARLVEDEGDVPEVNNEQLERIFDSIDQNMWTPPPGAKSTLELLREDRDQ